MELEYRPIQSQDKAEIKRLGARAFGPTGGAMVTLDDGGYVALDDDRIVGATILKVIATSRRRIGLVSYIMVDPSAQGRGIASHLSELAHEWFAQQKVDGLLAMVEGYNQSSSKLFQSRGYRRLTLTEQLRVFGASLPRVWLASFYAFSMDHFLWYREAGTDTEPGTSTSDTEPGTSTSTGSVLIPSLVGILIAIFVNSLLLGLAYLVDGGPWTLPLAPVAILGMATAIVGLRSLVLSLVARARGLRIRFKAWTGGLPLGLIIAAIGGYLPIPGTVYPRERSYRYREVLPAIGPASLAAGFALVLVYAGLAVLTLPAAAPVWLSEVQDFALSLFVPVLIVDLLLPFFPFWGYLGRQVWNWSRAAWVLLALAAVASIALRFLLA